MRIKRNCLGGIKGFTASDADDHIVLVHIIFVLLYFLHTALPAKYIEGKWNIFLLEALCNLLLILFRAEKAVHDHVSSLYEK